MTSHAHIEAGKKLAREADPTFRPVDWIEILDFLSQYFQYLHNPGIKILCQMIITIIARSQF